MVLLKILSTSEWEAAQALGVYKGSAVDLKDGFIHFSTADQVRETARRHFAGQSDLILLEVDSAALNEALRWEPSRGGQLFPHLYAPLALDAVVRHTPLPLVDGEHVFPEYLGR